MAAQPIRPTRQRALFEFIALHLALTVVVNLVFFTAGTFRPLASATGGLISGSLVANWLFIGLLVVWIILRRGSLRFYDVGLILRDGPFGILFTAGLWAAAQLIHVIAGLLHDGSLTLHDHWQYATFIISLLAAQIIGNALFEDTAYRGFLFPQAYLALSRLRRWQWPRLLLALLLSQGLFALSHIPNRIYLGMSRDALIFDLGLLLIWGLIFTAIYLRTDNLFVVIGVHALGNAPTTLITPAPGLSGAGESLLIYALAVFGLFMLPPILRGVQHERAYRRRRAARRGRTAQRAMQTDPRRSADDSPTPFAADSE
ncbi:MAG: CPBP family intramembrane metalloprotease [Chloroflexi bacterium]|nr:CPBP family intramembrane metalloprotease [Chloroflexota bacterium]